MCFSTNPSSFKKEPTSSAQGMFSLFIYSLSLYSREKTDLTVVRSLVDSPRSPLTVFFFLFRSSNHHCSSKHSAYWFSYIINFNFSSWVFCRWIPLVFRLSSGEEFVILLTLTLLDLSNWKNKVNLMVGLIFGMWLDFFYNITKRLDAI